MQATLKIVVKTDGAHRIKEALAILEAIKHDHPDLFQQAEAIIEW